MAGSSLQVRFCMDFQTADEMKAKHKYISNEKKKNPIMHIKHFFCKEHSYTLCRYLCVIDIIYVLIMCNSNII